MDTINDNIFLFCSINDDELKCLINDFRSQEVFSIEAMDNLVFNVINSLDQIRGAVAHDQPFSVSSKCVFIDNLNEIVNNNKFDILNFYIRSILTNLQTFLEVCFYEIL